LRTRSHYQIIQGIGFHPLPAIGKGTGVPQVSETSSAVV
jgi:hypothetical protein